MSFDVSEPRVESCLLDPGQNTVSTTTTMECSIAAARAFRDRSLWSESLAQCRTSPDFEADSAQVVGVGFVVLAVADAVACKHLLFCDKPELEALYGFDSGVQDVDEIIAVSESIECLLRSPSKARGIDNRGADSQQVPQIDDCQLRSGFGLTVDDKALDDLG